MNKNNFKRGLFDLRALVRAHADPAKALHLKKFFKTGKGQYAEGDQFLGIVVPAQRKIAQQFLHLNLRDVRTLIQSPIHEERLIALFILIEQYKKGTLKTRQTIYTFYLKHSAYINNWDLVDASAHHIVGAHLEGKDKAILKRLAASNLLWERRIAMVACFWEIRKGRHEPAVSIAALFLKDEHDLMHKATGWMLREVGKRASKPALEEFLKRHHKTMPRTMLRYAIEHFSEDKRQAYLNSEPPTVT